MAEPQRLRRPIIRPNAGTARRLLRRADQSEVADAAQKVDIGIDVVISRNGVENEIETAGMLFDRLGIFRDDHFVGAEPKCIFLLAGRSGEDHGLSSERMRELYPHVA